MGLFAKNPNDIIKESIEYMQSNTAISSTGPGSKFRSLLEIIKQQLDEAYNTFDQNIAVGFVHGSHGKYLDYLGEMLGVTRGKAISSQIYDDSNTIKLYVTSGTFGDINSSSNIVIPKGTKLWAKKNGQNIYFITTKEETLLAASSSKFISAMALKSGEESNVGASTITNHEFSNYTDSQNNTLKVTNITSIDSASNEESDENYRYRIINSSLANMAGNNMSLRMAALSVGGVADVKIIERHYGASRVGILVKSTTPTISDNLLAIVQDSVNKVKSEGINVVVSAPDYLSMSFSIKLNLKPSTTPNEKEIIKSIVKNTIADYVNNLDIGEEFNSTQLYRNIITSHDNILSLGSSGKPFESIIITKQLPNTTFTINKNVVQNYSPMEYEKIILSTSATSVTFI